MRVCITKNSFKHQSQAKEYSQGLEMEVAKTEELGQGIREWFNLGMVRTRV